MSGPLKLGCHKLCCFFSFFPFFYFFPFPLIATLLLFYCHSFIILLIWIFFLAVLFSLFWSVSNRSFRPVLFLSLSLCTALQYVILYVLCFFLVATAPACAVSVLVFVIVFLL